MLYTFDGIDVYLEAGADGTGDVFISKKSADMTYVFTIQSIGGGLLLKNSRMRAYTPVSPDLITEEASGDAEEATR